MWLTQDANEWGHSVGCMACVCVLNHWYVSNLVQTSFSTHRFVILLPGSWFRLESLSCVFTSVWHTTDGSAGARLQTLVHFHDKLMSYAKIVTWKYIYVVCRFISLDCPDVNDMQFYITQYLRHFYYCFILPYKAWCCSQVVCVCTYPCLLCLFSKNKGRWRGHIHI